MAKKHPIPMRRDDDLAFMDTELEDAIERLAATNEKVRGLLETFGPSPEQPPADRENAGEPTSSEAIHPKETVSAPSGPQQNSQPDSS